LGIGVPERDVSPPEDTLVAGKTSVPFEELCVALNSVFVDDMLAACVSLDPAICVPDWFGKAASGVVVLVNSSEDWPPEIEFITLEITMMPVKRARMPSNNIIIGLDLILFIFI